MDNIITLGEVFNVSISDPVILGIAIAKPRYSHELISATREFVVNLPTSSMVETVDRCGSVSGRDVDKFVEFRLTMLPIPPSCCRDGRDWYARSSKNGGNSQFLI